MVELVLLLVAGLSLSVWIVGRYAFHHPTQRRAIWATVAVVMVPPSSRRLFWALFVVIVLLTAGFMAASLLSGPPAPPV